MVPKNSTILKFYSRLLKEHGHQKWWSVSGFTTPKEWEICMGAILTQNTAWRNVEMALFNLKNSDIRNMEDILNLDIRKLRDLVKPAGFFNQKSKRLKIFAHYVLERFGSFENFLKNAKREDLMEINGIGPETADSILLYACGKRHFVVDAYTRRIFSRLSIIDESWKYERIQEIFENNIPKNIGLYKEFHALIVRHAKECCKKNPSKPCILINPPIK